MDASRINPEWSTQSHKKHMSQRHKAGYNPVNFLSITIVISLRLLDSCTILSMGLDLLFFGFFQRIAVGVGTVLVLLLVTWLGLPRRSAIVVSRRTIR